LADGFGILILALVNNDNTCVDFQKKGELEYAGFCWGVVDRNPAECLIDMLGIISSGQAVSLLLIDETNTVIYRVVSPKFNGPHGLIMVRST